MRELHLTTFEYQIVYLLATLDAMGLTQVHNAKPSGWAKQVLLDKFPDHKAPNKIYASLAKDCVESNWNLQLAQRFEQSCWPTTLAQLLEFLKRLLFIDPPAVLANTVLIVVILSFQCVVAVGEDFWYFAITVPLALDRTESWSKQCHIGKSVCVNKCH